MTRRCWSTCCTPRSTYDDGSDRASLSARGRARGAAARGARGDRDRDRRDPAGGGGRRGRVRAALLAYGSRRRARRSAAADILAEHGICGDRRRRPLREADRCRPAAQLAVEHELLVTVEEGVLAGGFGSAVWETLNDAGVDGRGSCGSVSPTSTSPTARPRLLHELVGFTRPSGSPSGSRQRRPDQSSVI